MKTPKLVEYGFHQCDGCGQIHHASELLDIEDMHRRVTAGGTAPSGECPVVNCGALCYPVEEGREVEEVVAVAIGVTAFVSATEEGCAGMNEEEQSIWIADQVAARLQDLIDDRDTLLSQINNIEVMDRRLID